MLVKISYRRPQSTWLLCPSRRHGHRRRTAPHVPRACLAKFSLRVRSSPLMHRARQALLCQLSLLPIHPPLTRLCLRYPQKQPTSLPCQHLLGSVVLLSTPVPPSSRNRRVLISMLVLRSDGERPDHKATFYARLKLSSG